MQKVIQFSEVKQKCVHPECPLIGKVNQQTSVSKPSFYKLELKLIFKSTIFVQFIGKIEY